MSLSVRSNHVDFNEYEEFVLRVSWYEWLGWRVNWKSCGGWVVGWGCGDWMGGCGIVECCGKREVWKVVE